MKYYLHRLFDCLGGSYLVPEFLNGDAFHVLRFMILCSNIHNAEWLMTEITSDWVAELQPAQRLASYIN